MGGISEDREDCDELEGERRNGVPSVEEEVDAAISRLLFSFLKCSSRLCTSLASVISDGGGGRLTWANRSSVDLLRCAGGIWPGLISSCSFGRAANPVKALGYTKKCIPGGGTRTLCQPQECSL